MLIPEIGIGGSLRTHAGQPTIVESSIGIPNLLPPCPNKSAHESGWMAPVGQCSKLNNAHGDGIEIYIIINNK